MKNELKFRITRIIFILIFLVFSSILWKDTYNDNISAKNYLDSLSNTNFVELSNGINMTSAYPVNDNIGSRGESYKFKIINNGNDKEDITIVVLNSLDNDYISYDNIRYQVIKNNEVFIESKTLNNNGIMFYDSVNSENIYEVKFWIKEDASIYEIIDKSFRVKIALL